MGVGFRALRAIKACFGFRVRGLGIQVTRRFRQGFLPLHGTSKKATADDINPTLPIIIRNIPYFPEFRALKVVQEYILDPKP